MNRSDARAITRARVLITALADHPDHAFPPFASSDYERALIDFDTICGPQAPGLPALRPAGQASELYEQALNAITVLGDLGILDGLQVELVLDVLDQAFTGPW